MGSTFVVTTMKGHCDVSIAFQKLKFKLPTTDELSADKCAIDCPNPADERACLCWNLNPQSFKALDSSNALSSVLNRQQFKTGVTANPSMTQAYAKGSPCLHVTPSPSTSCMILAGLCINYTYISMIQ
jgi:hypothetical protein